ncbi:hypothetical protein CEXT_299041 [Caerostris extrusa]|uniref:Uncharacterized protein n=1 Tax=Caerostris extrusa TaxID=172846 RepID=A0AAV4VL07_CAEEX|nr:hypothetical protein CEXT_299041 [Caerostris extrusa]
MSGLWMSGSSSSNWIHHIFDDFELRRLGHSVLQHVSTLSDADRCSLFLDQRRERPILSTTFDDSQPLLSQPPQGDVLPPSNSSCSARDAPGVADSRRAEARLRAGPRHVQRSRHAQLLPQSLAERQHSRSR